MIRLFICAFILGSMPFTLLHIPALAVPGGLVVAGLAIAARLYGQHNGTVAPSNCPFCGKKVKLGASACHHCGRQVVAG